MIRERRDKKISTRGYKYGYGPAPSESKRGLASGQGNIIPPRPGRLMPLREAAAELGLSLWSLRRLIWEGELPVVRFRRGRKLFVDRRDVDRFVEEHKGRLI